MGKLVRARNRVARRVFEVGQRTRIDILPRHFYSSIPDMAELRRREDWRSPMSMIGVPGVADMDRQLGFLRGLPFAYVPEDVFEGAGRENGAVGFGPVEAGVLYAVIAGCRPDRVVQVGAGASTAVMLRAAKAAGHRLDLTCIDPYPTAYLRELAEREAITLLTQPAQEVALDRLTDLAQGDLLFVDSTHTVKPGSEVNRLILEVLPRLAPGVLVHFHDITWPYDYPRDILADGLFFWAESTLLHAFMVGNAGIDVLACLSYLHYERPNELQQLLPWYRPAPSRQGMETSREAGHFPASLYLVTRSLA